MRRAVGIGLLAVVACGQDIAPPPVRNLDRPSEIAFACWGDVRLNGGDPDVEDPDGAIIAQPIQSCIDHARGEPPPGQEDVVPPKMFGFVLQSSRGTAAVIDVASSSVLDADHLSPGKNSIPIGTLPVGLVADRSGCHMVSANAGSCDLSILDTGTAVAARSAAAASSPASRASASRRPTVSSCAPSRATWRPTTRRR